MKVKLLTLILFNIISGICFSQQVLTNTPISTKLTNNGNIVSLVDMNGKSFKSIETDIKGSVFILDDWQKGNIQLNNGAFAINISLKINSVNNYVHFKNDEGVEMFKEASEIRMIEILQVGNADVVTNIYNTYETQKNGKNTTQFYEQLSNGKISLLKLIRKELKTTTNDFTKEITKEYVQYQDYYIYFKEEIIELKRKQSFFEKLMNNNWGEMEKYISDNKINFKQIDDIKKLVAYYNTN